MDNEEEKEDASQHYSPITVKKETTVSDKEPEKTRIDGKDEDMLRRQKLQELKPNSNSEAEIRKLQECEEENYIDSVTKQGYRDSVEKDNICNRKEGYGIGERIECDTKRNINPLQSTTMGKYSSLQWKGRNEIERFETPDISIIEGEKDISCSEQNTFLRTVDYEIQDLDRRLKMLNNQSAETLERSRDRLTSYSHENKERQFQKEVRLTDRNSSVRNFYGTDVAKSIMNDGGEHNKFRNIYENNKRENNTGRIIKHEFENAGVREKDEKRELRFKVGGPEYESQIMINENEEMRLLQENTNRKETLIQERETMIKEKER